MKNIFLLIAFCVFIFSNAASAQNTFKIFDAKTVEMSVSNRAADFYSSYEFNSNQITLSCPTNTIPYAFLTGPNGGTLIADNYLTVNETNVCPTINGRVNCFARTIVDPMMNVGMSPEYSYIGVNPIDISSIIRRSGTYSFAIKDLGYTFGNSEIYLTTSCQLNEQESRLCHRTNGSRGSININPGDPSFAAHIAHGDTVGTCD